MRTSKSFSDEELNQIINDPIFEAIIRYRIEMKRILLLRKFLLYKKQRAETK